VQESKTKDRNTQVVGLHLGVEYNICRFKRGNKEKRRQERRPDPEFPRSLRFQTSIQGYSRAEARATASGCNVFTTFSPLRTSIVTS